MANNKPTGAFVMGLRTHRKSLRLFATGLCVVIFVYLIILVGASVAAIWPPQLAPAPEPSSTVSPSTVQAPIVEADITKTAVAVLIVIALLAIFLRWLITDRRLEKLRLRAGDLTVVNGRQSTEEQIREISTADDGDDASDGGLLDDYFAELENYLTGTFAMTTRHLLEEQSESPERDSWMLASWSWRRWLAGRAKPGATPFDVVNLAARAVVTPTTVFARVTERRVLDDERASVTLTRTVEGSSELKALIFVPVLRIPKGELLGSLSVSINDKPGRTLTMSSSRGAIIRSLRSMVLRIAGTSPSDRDVLRTFAENATRAIASDLATDDEVRGRWLADLDSIRVSAPNEEVHRWLRALVDIAVATDIVFAIVPEGCAKTTRITVVYDEPYRVPSRSLVDRCRRLIGIGLSEFKVDLHRAAEARTYHLDVRGNSNSYVEQADVVFPNGAAATSTDSSRSELLHIAPLRGDAHAHVYWRDFGGWGRAHRGASAAATPQFHLRLRERPPGLIGPTAALSTWMFIITWTVGYYYPVLFTAATSVQSAWTTLILAAPALLTGWLLSRLTAETVRIMSVSVFALVVWLSINVAATVTISALTLSGVRTLTWDPIPGVTINNASWAILLFSTAAHLFASCLLFLGRGARYSRTINEEVGA